MNKAWSAAALALLAGNALAATAWQGEAVIDTATSACTGSGLIPKSVLKSVLQPKDLTDNTANTIVTFDFNSLGMFAMVLDHGAMPSGTAAAFGNTIGGAVRANVGVVYDQFVQTPSTIAFNTPDATLSGVIKDFMFIPNCNVSLRAAYTKNNGS